MLRELQRKLTADTLEIEAQRFALYWKLVKQQPKDKNKIYSLYESVIYCVGKGKDHNPYKMVEKRQLSLLKTAR